ncbi:MAG: hypothetical protein HETSPECPRED_010355 [Heterodermia speciosa]|uniref:NADP-dependent oxidoreductase domain-containing protein n=1 Tax=Heterodermia speciosa TaxID=116794 RepID=A0A8H3G1W0_9LECA|nr:MAG: hypothetical protein HETSPECPRED_010355 [Heterodermia speciosa]
MPLLGFGTWNLDKSNVSTAVSTALLTGYRHIDGAAIYGNEKEVGKGIAHGLAELGLRREDIWVTSKLWNDHHERSKVGEALDTTLTDLGIDYLDLYLMHWPVASVGGRNTIDYIETWHAMEKLLRTGKVRHIGVSNFDPVQLNRLIKRSAIKPAFHQFELHPYLQQNEWVQVHKDHGINVTAYSPFGNTNPTYTAPGDDENEPPLLLENSIIANIALVRGCTPAQVVLAWGIHRGTSVIPKSSHAARIEENYGTLRCQLQKSDFEEITAIGEKYVRRFNNPAKGWGVDLYEGLEDD